jgi:hypothetical protein
MELNQQEKKLLESLNKMVKDYYPEWKTLLSPTSINAEKVILDYLKSEGDKAGFYVALNETSTEFPFSMIWYDNVRGKLSKKRVLTEIELILEWEFRFNQGYEGIMSKFEKLLFASPNIPFKIFICLLGNNKKLGEVKSYFDDAVQSCRTVVNGDSFICLIGDDYGRGEFIVHKVVKH